MQCFELIKMVLDEAYNDVPGTLEEKDSAIKVRLKELSHEYHSLMQGPRVDYRDPVTRFAYIYKYVTSHAMMVYTSILRNKELSGLFGRDKVTVSCIGGGPGSDLVGILKYLAENGRTRTLKCYLLDKEKAWSESWSDVDDKLGVNDLRFSSNFIPLDVEDPLSWSVHTKFLRSDLFTLVYFMSELYARKESASPFFEYLFREASPGSLFLYIDNRDAAFNSWFDSLVILNGMTTLVQDDTRFKLPPKEEKESLGEYFLKFGATDSPRLQGKISYRIVYKK